MPARGHSWVLRVAWKPLPNGKGVWTVDNPKGKVFRGWKPNPAANDPGRDPDTIEWKLLAPPGRVKPNISAHFQFAHDDLLTGCGGPGRITKHLTATIPAPGRKLKLRLQKRASTDKNPRYYAVWIEDRDYPGRSGFAIGHNPPPEIDVGP